jgi:hypothetical protein
MTAEMMLSLLREARQHTENGEPPLAARSLLASAMAPSRSFVAGSIVAEHGATERLAVAFETLVPENDRKERLLDLAKETACTVDRSAARRVSTASGRTRPSLLMSYSDKNFVSDEYGRELSGARTQASKSNASPTTRPNAFRHGARRSATRRFAALTSH